MSFPVSYAFAGNRERRFAPGTSRFRARERPARPGWEEGRQGQASDQGGSWAGLGGEAQDLDLYTALRRFLG
jgi:hypothetical protein